MRREHMGVPVYTPRTTRGVQKPRSKAPKLHGRYYWRLGEWWVLMEWKIATGLYPVSAHQMKAGLPVSVRVFPALGVKTVRKWAATAAPSPDGEQPLPTSTVLKKFPRLLAFLTDRWYDDRTPRLPGSVWFDSDMGAAKALLKEPSLMLCARLRAATIDDLYAAVEAFLGMDAPPWEPDKYAEEKAAEKKKKK